MCHHKKNFISFHLQSSSSFHYVLLWFRSSCPKTFNNSAACVTKLSPSCDFYFTWKVSLKDIYLSWIPPSIIFQLQYIGYFTREERVFDALVLKWFSIQTNGWRFPTFMTSRSACEMHLPQMESRTCFRVKISKKRKIQGWSALGELIPVTACDCRVVVIILNSFQPNFQIR